MNIKATWFYLKYCIKAYWQMPKTTDFIIQTMDEKSSHSIFVYSESVNSQMVMQIATLVKLRKFMPVTCSDKDFLDLINRCVAHSLNLDVEKEKANDQVA